MIHVKKVTRRQYYSGAPDQLEVEMEVNSHKVDIAWTESGHGDSDCLIDGKFPGVDFDMTDFLGMEDYSGQEITEYWQLCSYLLEIADEEVYMFKKCPVNIISNEVGE